VLTFVRRPLQPVSTRIAIAGGVAVALLGFAAAYVKSSPQLYLTALALVAGAGIAYLAVWTRPATFVSLALAGTLLSGNADQVGLPVSPDRLLWIAALGALVAKLPGALLDRRVMWRPLHAAFALTIAYGVVSAAIAATLTTSEGLFGLLDRLGALPMVAFVLAPVIFRDERDRSFLVKVLIVTGGYLGVTAIAEGLNLDWLVYPKYILDPGVGIHFSRARGPFVEAVAMGLALYGCAVAAVLGVVTLRSYRWRRAGVLVAAMCIIGTLFTLTRAIWLATVIASCLALLLDRRTRRLVVPLAALGAVVVLALFAFVPAVADQAEGRSGEKLPVWDRLGSNQAALRAIEDHPLFGVGWNRWLDVNKDYIRPGADYPITPGVTRIEIHNVVLSHLAELGIVGAALWATAIVGALGAALLRPGPANLEPWRAALAALAVHWFIVAMLGPLSYAFPNLLLWLVAGICAQAHVSTKTALVDR
jgi:putative inorganic carbon (HCO3(-)) transporter